MRVSFQLLPRSTFYHLNIHTMTQEIYFAGGCFWGTEHFFKLITGVVDTQVGYANGTLENPTYEQVCSHRTGHAETVKVTFDSEQVGLEFLLDMFFTAIDPTQTDGQGPDVGPQYRTGIYYTLPEQRPVIEERVAREAEHYFKPIMTEVLPLRCFYPAEEYHQDYLDKNPGGYCHLPLGLFELARRAKPSHD